MPAAGQVLSGARELRVLFLCTGNACRSQMAEGWARALRGDVITPDSAGILATRLDRRAVAVMAEMGVDISGQCSKSLDELRDPATGVLPRYDYVVTVCGYARETCPAFPGRTRVVHQGFDDPLSLALGAATEEDALQHYRRVRDEIRAFIEQLPAALRASSDERPSRGEGAQ